MSNAERHFHALGHADGLFNQLQLHGVRSKALAEAYAAGYREGCELRLHATFAQMQAQMTRLERI